jgi:5-methylcytosine-specific restriction endonuclease McrA
VNNRLRRRELCPLHRSYYCDCHGPRKEKARPFAKPRKPDVERVIDAHHPRGYREICSPAELRRRKNLLILQAEGHPRCYLCGEEFSSYQEIELEHIEPKGMGGAWHDDHIDNLALAHRSCNREKGSRRIA